mmetsp:Transcript_19222/g.42497  ORF Transcript_19222/g.42497 Transcript_19222/m.42497 type:complete len:278 (+) Transcript_19222:914-1747(+)
MQKVKLHLRLTLRTSLEHSDLLLTSHLHQIVTHNVLDSPLRQKLLQWTTIVRDTEARDASSAKLEILRITVPQPTAQIIDQERRLQRSPPALHRRRRRCKNECTLLRRLRKLLREWCCRERVVAAHAVLPQSWNQTLHTIEMQLDPGRHKQHTVRQLTPVRHHLVVLRIKCLTLLLHPRHLLRHHIRHLLHCRLHRKQVRASQSPARLVVVLVRWLHNRDLQTTILHQKLTRCSDAATSSSYNHHIVVRLRTAESTSQRKSCRTDPAQHRRHGREPR